MPHFSTVFQFNVPSEFTVKNDTGIFLDIRAKQVSTFSDGKPAFLIEIIECPIYTLSALKNLYRMNLGIEKLVEEKYESFMKISLQ